MEDRPVLGDDRVEAREVARDPPQVGELPARRQDHDDSPASDLRNGVAHGGIERVIDRDRPVVIKGEC